MKYIVLLNDQSIEVDLDRDHITVAGQTYTATLSSIPGTPLRQLLLDGSPLILPMEAMGGGRWVLMPGGEHWDVEVIDERTRHIRDLTATDDRRRLAGVLQAPMPGLVLRVQARPGEEVAAGTGLIVLEAMKMENELTAAAPGIVKAVRVAPGDAVEKGQVLVEFEGEKER